MWEVSLLRVGLQVRGSYLSKGASFISPQQSDVCCQYKVADKSLARSGRKQATATEDFDFDISYL